MALSDTALKLLSAAALRDDRLVKYPPKLPAAARNSVIRSLLKQGLVEEVRVQEAHRDMAWRRNAGGD